MPEGGPECRREGIAPIMKILSDLAKCKGARSKLLDGIRKNMLEHCSRQIPAGVPKGAVLSVGEPVETGPRGHASSIEKRNGICCSIPNMIGRTDFFVLLSPALWLQWR